MPVPTRILIVEDNPVDVRMIRFALEKEATWATQTTVADDGEHAIQFLLKSPGSVDFVILDLNLPKMDGAEVLRIIRSTQELTAVSVIVLSSQPENVSEHQLQTLNLKADPYLRKPVGPNEFLKLGELLHESYRRAVGPTRRNYLSNSG